MGYRPPSHRRSPTDQLEAKLANEFKNKLDNALNNDAALASLVKEIVTTNKMEGLVIGTTKTAYRRIHEYIASVIDKAIEKLRAIEKEKPGTGRLSGSEIADILVDLSRSLVLVEYQRVRGQIKKGIADVVSTMLTKLEDRLSSIEGRTDQEQGRTDQQRLEELRKSLERARIIIDSIIVLVEKYAEKHPGERGGRGVPAGRVI